VARWKAFSPAERDAVYRAIHERRDIRSYTPDPVPPDVLTRILDAAHRAGSVGLMQPWNFLLIADRDLRTQVHAHFLACNAQAAELHQGDRRQTYMSLKLQGILDAPLNLLVTCDTRRGGPHVLGRSHIRETDVYSTCLAVQNLWLAARAEGVGVGWMSIMEPAAIRALFSIPEHVIPVAYLTLGTPIEFPDEPLLQSVGWRRRLALEEVVFQDRWAQPPSDQPLSPLPPRPRAGSPVAVPAAAIARQAELTKPPGSLGRLEQVALQLAALQGCARPRCEHRWLLLMAADHGVTVEGVSAYKPHLTAQMVYQFIAGGAAVNAIARQGGLSLRIADLGVAHDFGDATGLAHHKVALGTRNLAQTAAMTPDQVEQAIEAGRQLVRELPELDVLALGEMGIGNSTAAAAMAAALLGRSGTESVGPGTGVGPGTRAHKAQVVDRALALHRDQLDDPTRVLQHLGGFELAGLVGAIEAAAERRALVILDGFITGVAALVAVRRDPGLRDFLVAGHLSAEPAHGPILEALGLEPLLDLGMRLGEGSGAALAASLVEAAARTQREMTTFAEAGIENPRVPEAQT